MFMLISHLKQLHVTAQTSRLIYSLYSLVKKKKKKKIIGIKFSNIQSVPTFISTTIMATDGHVGRDGLFEKLKELGIETSTVEHPEVKHTSNTFVKFNRKILGFCVKFLL